MAFSPTLKAFAEPIRPRMKPQFLIIGAQKAGTSALHQMLGMHPLIIPSKPKEIHFFDRDDIYAKGFEWYLRHFPPKPLRNKGHIVFEATPSYLFFADKVAQRIRQHLPHVACIAILRDPVKRAFSAWNMLRDFKNNPKYHALHDSRTFAQAVEDELAGRTLRFQHQYLARGFYADQLRTFKDNFPEDQLWVYSYLALKHNPNKLVNEICSRLGLPLMPINTGLRHMRANKRPYNTELDPGLAKELYAYFAPEVIKLKEELGYNLNILENDG